MLPQVSYENSVTVSSLVNPSVPSLSYRPTRVPLFLLTHKSFERTRAVDRFRRVPGPGTHSNRLSKIYVDSNLLVKCLHCCIPLSREGREYKT